MAKIISFRYYYLYEKEMKDKKHLENKELNAYAYMILDIVNKNSFTSDCFP